MVSYKCSKDLYRSYLVASSVRYSCLSLSDVSPSSLSHDAASRWLKSKKFSPSEVWSESRQHIDLSSRCLLIADDTVLDKSRSQKIDLVHWQYSGNAHDIIAGIGMVNMVWHGLDEEVTIPIDYRLYDKDSDGKTKNEHFCDMLKLAKERGVNPEAVVVDTWYSSLNNLKCLRSLEWDWVAGLRKNRKVNRNETLENLDIPDEGLKVHLRGYGWVWVFRFVANERRTDYIATSIENPSRDEVERIMKARWGVEVYHRELKQTCGLERCQSRTGRAQRNHICLAVLAWLYQFKRRCQSSISLYQQKWDVIKDAIANNLKMMLAETA